MKQKNTTSVLKMMLLLLFVIPWGCKDKVEISERLTAITFNYPVLKGKVDNPILRIQLNDGKEGEIVNAIQVSIENTKQENLKNIRVYYTENDSVFSNKRLFGLAEKPKKASLINGNQSLKPGTNYFWVSYELEDSVDLTNKVHANIDYVNLGEQKTWSIK